MVKYPKNVVLTIGGYLTMRFFWTLVWALLLVNMISYVIASMQGDTYNFVIASGVAVVFTVIVSLIGAVLPNDPVEKH